MFKTKFFKWNEIKWKGRIAWFLRDKVLMDFSALSKNKHIFVYISPIDKCPVFFSVLLYWNFLGFLFLNIFCYFGGFQRNTTISTLYRLPLNSPIFFSTYLPPNFMSSLSIFYKPLSPIGAVCMCMGVEPLSIFLNQSLVSFQTQYYIVTLQRMILGLILSLGH